MGGGVADAGTAPTPAIDGPDGTVSGPARTAVGLTVTADRVLIQADQESHAPRQRDSGLYTATSLASAVEGQDAEASWFVGTVVQVGPLVNAHDVRRFALRHLDRLIAFAEDGARITRPMLAEVYHAIEICPDTMPDPIAVGDRVVFSWAAGQQVTIDGAAYLILRAGDVLARLEA